MSLEVGLLLLAPDLMPFAFTLTITNTRLQRIRFSSGGSSNAPHNTGFFKLLLLPSTDFTQQQIAVPENPNFLVEPNLSLCDILTTISRLFSTMFEDSSI
jgi:hypothetical protein